MCPACQKDKEAPKSCSDYKVIFAALSGLMTRLRHRKKVRRTRGRASGQLLAPTSCGRYLL